MRAIVLMLRLPNLLIIAVTFCMLRYLVFVPVYAAYCNYPGMDSLHFVMMVTATMIIAAAGYISNDYFDIATDRVNKPNKLYIGKVISPGTALATALLLSVLAIGISLWISISSKTWMPGFLLLLALGVAWWYAIVLKRSFVWGNVAVSCMSAGTIAMAWLVEMQYSHVPTQALHIITGIVTAISIFAFLLSLMREIVKDAEDIEGDSLIHCRSLPLTKGIPFTKGVLMVIISITMLMLMVVQYYLVIYSLLVAAIWLFAAVEIPLIYTTILLAKAKQKSDYHYVSTLIKWTMLGGMMAMVAGRL